MSKRIRIGVLGMGFGHSFAEIYRLHPDVESVGICDTNAGHLGWHKNNTGPWAAFHTDPREMLEGKQYDAVHVCTPVTTHVPPTLSALAHGKHVACAVPMATSIEDLEKIVAEQKRTGLNYMMMETAKYHCHYIEAQKLYQAGRLGQIQFMRGCHYQDLEGINPLWWGLPPMWYMTHAVGPLLDIVDTQAEEVCCFGSGVMRQEFHAQYGNPYSIETAIFTLRNHPARMEITRSLFETAVRCEEGFDFYGTLGTYQTIGLSTHLTEISPLTKTGEIRKITTTALPWRWWPELLPEQLRSKVEDCHGGSHPFLAHEFVRSIVEGRPPYIHAARAANWCAPGICAHQSAMHGGAKVSIPQFS